MKSIPKQPKSPEPITGSTNNTPADMLVSELFESFKAKSSKPTPKSLTLDNNPPGMAIPVVEFYWEGYKIRKIIG